MKKTLSSDAILTQGFKVGLKNYFTILGAGFLYLMTCWIPYFNIGTTIGINKLLISIGKGEKKSAFSIFEASHRQDMCDFLIVSSLLIGILYFIAQYFIGVTAIAMYMFLFAQYVVLDKKVHPFEALRVSYSITYGHKWSIFLSGFLFIFFVAFLGGLINLFQFQMSNEQFPSLANLTLQNIRMFHAYLPLLYTWIVLIILSTPIFFGMNSYVYNELRNKI